MSHSPQLNVTGGGNKRSATKGATTGLPAAIYVRSHGNLRQIIDQEHVCAEHCNSRGLRIAGVYRDLDTSGRGRRILEKHAADERFGYVIVADDARISRHVLALMDFVTTMNKIGISVCTANGDVLPERLLMLSFKPSRNMRRFRKRQST